MNRRRDGQASQSPLETLQQMPALVVLERLPVPVLAVAADGKILFANAAFATMLARAVDDVLAMQFSDIFLTRPEDDSVVSLVRAHADLIVELRHAEGAAVRARLSRSALLRGDDPVALVTFQDLTEQLWVQEN